MSNIRKRKSDNKIVLIDFGANLIKVSITGKTTARLQEANLFEQVDECAVIGIKLLHRKLVPVQSMKIKKVKKTN